MDSGQVKRRRKRSRFASTAAPDSPPAKRATSDLPHTSQTPLEPSTNTITSASPPATAAPVPPVAAAPLSFTAFPRGKSKSAARRLFRPVPAPLAAFAAPPDVTPPPVFAAPRNDLPHRRHDKRNPGSTVAVTAASSQSDSDLGGDDDSPSQKNAAIGFLPPLSRPAEQNTPTLADTRKRVPNGIETRADPLDAFMSSLPIDAQPSQRPPDSHSAPGGNTPSNPPDTAQDVDETPEAALSLPSRPAAKQKRVYNKVDHLKISYPPFEKNLYIEVPELAALTVDQIAERRRALGNVRVRGRNCPAPIATWPQCGLSVALLNVLSRCNFTDPTAVQAQAIPAVMAGRDVIGVARTGSGKTLAFVLPLLRHAARRPRAAPGDGPVALVVAPTRELAIQIFGDARRFAHAVSLRCVCAYGGSALKDQISELKRGADVVVCTPGRMIDLLAMNSGRITSLRRVSFVVLDEADRMFDMGFGPQVTRIVENVRPDRQTVMFSATFPSQVERLARRILTRPLEIVVGGKSVAAASIDQHIEVRSEESKFLRLLELLGLWYEKGSTLIFVDRQENADRIFRELTKARYKCLSLHGGMDQADRDSTIVDFKRGDIKVLVATSVAARGLDVKNLRLVVNYDVPSHYEDYVHRVGRTGRAGKTGTAYTFITREQEAFAPDLVKALEASERAEAEQAVGSGTGTDGEAKRKAADERVAAAVPAELRKLADGFLVKRKAGIVKHGGGSGYGGRGFSFEENDEYDAAKSAIRKMQAKQYGLEEGLVDDEDSEDEGEHGGNEDGGDASDEDGVVAIGAGGKTVEKRARGGIHVAGGLRGERGSERETARLVSEAVAKAEARADAERVDVTTRATWIAAARASVLSRALPAGSGNGGVATGGNAAATTTAGAAAEGGEEDEVAIGERFAAELEINDYAQHARWQVTRKGALDDVEEFTGCVVTTRGNFYPAGRNPPAGERKLHLLIEGPSRTAVRTARRDIRQKLDEAGAVVRPTDGQYSKYSVL